MRKDSLESRAKLLDPEEITSKDIARALECSKVLESLSDNGDKLVSSVNRTLKKEAVTYQEIISSFEDPSRFLLLVPMHLRLTLKGETDDVDYGVQFSFFEGLIKAQIEDVKTKFETLFEKLIHELNYERKEKEKPLRLLEKQEPETLIKSLISPSLGELEKTAEPTSIIIKKEKIQEAVHFFHENFVNFLFLMEEESTYIKTIADTLGSWMDKLPTYYPHSFFRNLFKPQEWKPEYIFLWTFLGERDASLPQPSEENIIESFNFFFIHRQFTAIRTLSRLLKDKNIFPFLEIWIEVHKEALAEKDNPVRNVVIDLFMGSAKPEKLKAILYPKKKKDPVKPVKKRIQKKVTQITKVEPEIERFTYEIPNIKNIGEHLRNGETVILDLPSGENGDSELTGLIQTSKGKNYSTPICIPSVKPTKENKIVLSPDILKNAPNGPFSLSLVLKCPPRESNPVSIPIPKIQRKSTPYEPPKKPNTPPSVEPTAIDSTEIDNSEEQITEEAFSLTEIDNSEEQITEEAFSLTEIHEILCESVTKQDATIDLQQETVTFRVSDEVSEEFGLSDVSYVVSFKYEEFKVLNNQDLSDDSEATLILLVEDIDLFEEQLTPKILAEMSPEEDLDEFKPDDKTLLWAKDLPYNFTFNNIDPLEKELEKKGITLKYTKNASKLSSFDISGPVDKNTSFTMYIDFTTADDVQVDIKSNPANALTDKQKATLQRFANRLINSIGNSWNKIIAKDKFRKEQEKGKRTPKLLDGAKTRFEENMGRVVIEGFGKAYAIHDEMEPKDNLSWDDLVDIIKTEPDAHVLLREDTLAVNDKRLKNPDTIFELSRIMESRRRQEIMNDRRNGGIRKKFDPDIIEDLKDGNYLNIEKLQEIFDNITYKPRILMAAKAFLRSENLALYNEHFSDEK